MTSERLAIWLSLHVGIVLDECGAIDVWPCCKHQCICGKMFCPWEWLGTQSLPTNDWSTFRVVLVMPEDSKDCIMCNTSSILPSGIFTCISVVSISRPRNVKQVDGPTVFSCAIGTPTLVRAVKHACKLCWQSLDPCCPPVWKSSK